MLDQEWTFRFDSPPFFGGSIYAFQMSPRGVMHTQNNIKIKWCTYLSKPMLKHHFPAKFGHSIKKKLCGTCAWSVCDSSHRGKHLLQKTTMHITWLSDKFEYIKGYIPMVEKHDDREKIQYIIWYTDVAYNTIIRYISVNMVCSCCI